MSAKRVNPLSHINWEFICNKVKRASATFVFNDNANNYYLHNGERITEKDFESAYPVEVVRINPKGDNKDGTHVRYDQGLLSVLEFEKLPINQAEKEPQ